MCRQGGVDGVSGVRRIGSQVLRLAMMYFSKMVVLTKRQKAKLEVAELKMLRFQVRLKKIDRISDTKG